MEDCTIDYETQLFCVLASVHGYMHELIVSDGDAPVIRFSDGGCEHTCGEGGSKGFTFGYDSRVQTQVTITFSTSESHLTIESDGEVWESQGTGGNTIERVLGTGSFEFDVSLNGKPAKKKILIVTKPDLDGPGEDALGGL